MHFCMYEAGDRFLSTLLLWDMEERKRLGRDTVKANKLEFTRTAGSFRTKCALGFCEVWMLSKGLLLSKMFFQNIKTEKMCQ